MTELTFPWTLDRPDADLNVDIHAEYAMAMHLPWYDQPEELTVRAVDRDGVAVVLTEEEARDLDLEIRDRVKQMREDVAIEAAMDREMDDHGRWD